ncbi:TolC family protein [Algoriphagus boritolerans]|uniref:Outer membrane protein n=1 Tax=Algoriphagus boritolerans DSM 17298 = JCM 18970 TaxID=1120964 RepID=A0A1H5SA81_9BACT|nr:TolC family protein [Algoriphagus boritolerans]SEF47543.1 outer membrane protein [Algoriphagus boritolerans DSM 17298 = JCM 18970]
MKLSQSKFTLLTLLGASLVWGKLKAQDTIPMNFEMAVELALTKNLDYRIQQNNMSILQKEKQVAMFSHLPSVGMSSNLLQQTGQQFQQIEGEIVVTNVSNDILTGNLNVTMPLFNSGRRILDTQSAILALEAGEKGLNRAKQQVIFDVSRRYLQVLLDQELVRIAGENLENQKQQLVQIEGFVDAGLRTMSDLYNQQSEVARLESVKVDAEIQYENDLWLLTEYLQLPPGVVPVIESVDPIREVSSFEGLDLTQLYDLAKSNRQDLTQQTLLANSFKKDMQAIKAMYFPRLNAFYNYNTFFTSLDQRSLREQFLRIYPQNTLGIGLTIPIFTNFQSRLEVGRSRVAYENQVLQKESIDRKVYQEVKLSYQNYLAALRKEKNAQVQVLAAEEAFNAVNERFRLGLSSFVEVSTANQTLVRAQADQAQAVYTLYFQDVLMKFALGTLDF